MFISPSHVPSMFTRLCITAATATRGVGVMSIMQPSTASEQPPRPPSRSRRHARPFYRKAWMCWLPAETRTMWKLHRASFWRSLQRSGCSLAASRKPTLYRKPKSDSLTSLHSFENGLPNVPSTRLWRARLGPTRQIRAEFLLGRESDGWTTTSFVLAIALNSSIPDLRRTFPMYPMCLERQSNHRLTHYSDAPQTLPHETACILRLLRLANPMGSAAPRR